MLLTYVNVGGQAQLHVYSGCSLFDAAQWSFFFFFEMIVGAFLFSCQVDQTSSTECRKTYEDVVWNYGRHSRWSSCLVSFCFVHICGPPSFHRQSPLVENGSVKAQPVMIVIQAREGKCIYKWLWTKTLDTIGLFDPRPYSFLSIDFVKWWMYDAFVLAALCIYIYIVFLVLFFDGRGIFAF